MERKYGTISGYKLYPYGRVQEFNPNHDKEDGQFTTGGGSSKAVTIDSFKSTNKELVVKIQDNIRPETLKVIKDAWDKAPKAFKKHVSRLNLNAENPDNMGALGGWSRGGLKIYDTPFQQIEDFQATVNHELGHAYWDNAHSDKYGKNYENPEQDTFRAFCDTFVGDAPTDYSRGFTSGGKGNYGDEPINRYNKEKGFKYPEIFYNEIHSEVTAHILGTSSSRTVIKKEIMDKMIPAWKALHANDDKEIERKEIIDPPFDWDSLKKKSGEDFKEEDHPRDNDGKFSSGGGGSLPDKVEQPITMTTTVIQGKEYPVGLRDKTNWEKHTTEDQRNDSSFKTSFSDNLRLSDVVPVERPKPVPKVEPVVEIPKQPPVPKPEDRPSGLNYRIESGKVILKSRIKSNGNVLERLKVQRPDMADMISTLEKDLQGFKDKLANIEKEDPKDLPYLPMGKNTHTKETDGFVHGSKTVIKVQPKVLTDPAYALINTTVQAMWNNLPDDVRDKVKTFKVQRSLGTKGFRGGSFNDWDGTLILNINKRSPIEHHFYHEIGHVVYDHIKRNNPEKTEKWIKAMKEITIAPTKYAEGYMDLDSRTIAKNMFYKRQQEKRGIPLTDFEKKRMADNEYTTKDIYENEIHSEISAYAMGQLPQRTMKYSREFTNKYLTAWKELNEI